MKERVEATEREGDRVGKKERDRDVGAIPCGCNSVLTVINLVPKFIVLCRFSLTGSTPFFGT